MKQYQVTRSAIALLLTGLWLGSTPAHTQDTDNEVIIPQAQSRSYMLTNSGAAFFFAETGGTNTSVMQGLSVKTEEYLEDYILDVDGALLSREDAEAHLFPTKLIRKYAKPKLDEEICLLDSIPVLTIKLTASEKHPIAFTPIIARSEDKDELRQVWSEEDNILYLSTQARMQKASQSEIPKLTAICTYPISDYHEQTAKSTTFHGKVKQNVFVPGKLQFQIDGTAYVFIIIGENKADILQKRKEVLRRFNIYFENSSKKVEGVRQT
ncbi:hypothetical protein JW960_12470 [candidate division KSB1 bacterium]|nr:hypothetical protein [candidate division KSB1 bacterium]